MEADENGFNTGAKAPVLNPRKEPGRPGGDPIARAMEVCHVHGGLWLPRWCSPYGKWGADGGSSLGNCGKFPIHLGLGRGGEGRGSVSVLTFATSMAKQVAKHRQPTCEAAIPDQPSRGGLWKVSGVCPGNGYPKPDRSTGALRGGDAPLLHPVAEGATGQAEEARDLGDVAAGVAQRLLDEVLLDRLESAVPVLEVETQLLRI